MEIRYTSKNKKPKISFVYWLWQAWFNTLNFSTLVWFAFLRFGLYLNGIKEWNLTPSNLCILNKPCVLYMLTCGCLFSCVLLLATPWTTACQAPLSMEFSRQEYWNRLPFPLRVSSQPRDPTRVSWVSYICRWILHHWATWKTGKSQETVERLAAAWTNSEADTRETPQLRRQGRENR